MRFSITRGVSALTLAGALTALAGPPAAAARQSSATPLSVSLQCEHDAFDCQAYASGGTGGYSFSWTNANEYDSGIGDSAASPHCRSSVGLLKVTVTVTDSSSATASASYYFDCSAYM